MNIGDSAFTAVEFCRILPDCACFCRILSNVVCKEFIQRLFSDRTVVDVKVSDIASVTTEAAVIPGIYSKSVRLDVRFSDDESIYNIEMQIARESDLPQRGRYYSAAIDVAHLKPGKPYGELKQSFVIFLCRFDYYDKDEAVYTFERIDKNLQLPYGDGSYIIIVNTKCSEEKIPEELRSLFNYINTAAVDAGDWFVEKIHQLVLRYQSDEEVAYMATLEDDYLRKITKAEIDATERLNKLNSLLLENGRIDELKKSLKNPAFQQQLLEEYGLAQ